MRDGRLLSLVLVIQLAIAPVTASGGIVTEGETK